MKNKVNKKGSIPQYIQIAKHISDDIKNGKYINGQQLMSVRGLAKKQEISHVTADKVFKYLEKEKLIKRIQGRGAFVSYDSPFNKKNILASEEVKYRYESLRNSDDCRSNLVNLFKNTSHRCTYNFSYSLLNSDKLNSLLPTINYLSKDQTTFELPRIYGQIKGYLPLRELLITELNSPYAIDEILITNGNQHGINLAVQSLINEGDNVLIETPTFTGAIDILYNEKATLIPLRIYENGFSSEYIEELCLKYSPKVMYLTPNYSNPTGYCLEHRERMKLIELAKRYNFYIIEDDHWSDFSYEESITPLAFMKDASSHVIYLKGFSKIIGPDNRISALLAPKHIADRIEQQLTLQSLGVAILPQQYLYALLKKGYYDKIIRSVRSDLIKRSQKVNESLRRLKPYGVEYDIPQGGLNYWIRLPENINAEELLFNKMYENNITFLPGSLLDVTSAQSSSNCIRLNFSYMSFNRLIIGLEKIVSLIEEHLINN